MHTICRKDDGMYISDIFKDYEHILCGTDKFISSLAIHSDIIGADCIFFAHDGENHSAREHVFDAIRKGASAVCTDDREVFDSAKLFTTAVLVSDSRHAESYAADKLYPVTDEMKIVGVTGTNGKTSVCHIAKKMFSYLSHSCAYTGSLGTNIKGYENILSNTTPPPSVYRKIVCDAQKLGMEYVFSEVSSQGILQKRSAHIPFHALLFTNLTAEHLDAHKTMENYYEAKKSVFTDNECFYIINISDTYGKRLYDELRGVKISVGYKQECDVFIRDLFEWEHGIAFCLELGGEKLNIYSSMYGRFNAENIAMVAALMYVEGFSPKDIEYAANSSLNEAVPGRMERFEFNGAGIFVDYAHTPDALENALISLCAMPHKRIITLFGCGGDRDKTKRKKMGRIASLYSDEVILTEDNSRSEEADEIISEIYSGCDTDITKIYPDRKQAIAYAVSTLSKGDILLVAGRGAEEYLETSSGKKKFSDRNLVEYLCRM